MLRSRFTAVLALICCVSLFTGCASRSRKAKPGAGGEMFGLGRGEIAEGQLGERPASLEWLDTVKFENVLFAYDSAQVEAAERGKVEKVASYLRSNLGVGVVVEGHCDERGSREYNMALGERRALAVRAYLIGLGVDAESVQTVSYGKEKPLLLGHDEQSWNANRRGEFVFFHQ